jgi:hypothetical protein
MRRIRRRRRADLDSPALGLGPCRRGIGGGQQHPKGQCSGPTAMRGLKNGEHGGRRMRRIRGKPKETPMHAWYLGGIDHRPFLHLFERATARSPRWASSVAGPANQADIPAGSA